MKISLWSWPNLSKFCSENICIFLCEGVILEIKDIPLLLVTRLLRHIVFNSLYSSLYSKIYIGTLYSYWSISFDCNTLKKKYIWILFSTFSSLLNLSAVGYDKNVFILLARNTVETAQAVRKILVHSKCKLFSVYVKRNIWKILFHAIFSPRHCKPVLFNLFWFHSCYGLTKYD